MKYLVTLILALSLLLPISSFAQSDQSLRLITSPLPVNLATKPGTSISTPLRVQNAGSQTETLKMGLLKFSAYGDTGAPQLQEREPGDDYFDWVSFSEDTFTLAPNQWKTITMTIAVPESAAFGYYYAATFSRAAENVEEGQSQAALVGSTATLVLLEAQVPGAKRQAEIQSFSTDKPWYEFLPVHFSANLRNTGNVHVAPRGNIFITRNGQEVATLEVNLAKGNILPESNRVFEVSWNDGFPHYVERQAEGKVVTDESSQPEYRLEWDFSQADTLRIGHYEAKLVMVYDDGTKDVPIEATTSFWIVPWRGLIVSLVVAILVGIGLWTTLRSGWRKARPKHS